MYFIRHSVTLFTSMGPESHRETWSIWNFWPESITRMDNLWDIAVIGIYYQSGYCGNIFCSEIQIAQYMAHSTYYDSEEFSVPLAGNPIIGDPEPDIVKYAVFSINCESLTVSTSTSSLLSSAELLNVFLNLSHTHDIGTELLYIQASESYRFITKGWSFSLSFLQTLPFLRYQSNLRIPKRKLFLYLSFTRVC